MKYSKNIISSFILILTVATSSCWEFFMSMMDKTIKDTLEAVPANNEYIYGDCLSPKQILYTSLHVPREKMVGQIILRDWLDIKRTPLCIIIKGIANDTEIDVYKNTAYSFQFCVLRATFLHSQRRFLYYYYEWYIPYDFDSNMDWDIYFYGPDLVNWE